MAKMDMGALLKQAQKMKSEMEKLQAEASHAVYTSSAGGGAVVASVSGEKRLVELNLNEEMLKNEQASFVSDMIICAVNDALEQCEAEYAQKMGGLTGGLNIPGL